jgi:hypothetical protein
MPTNVHGRGSADTQLNTTAFNRGDDDPDVLVNHDFFPDTPSQH